MSRQDALAGRIEPLSSKTSRMVPGVQAIDVELLDVADVVLIEKELVREVIDIEVVGRLCEDVVVVEVDFDVDEAVLPVEDEEAIMLSVVDNGEVVLVEGVPISVVDVEETVELLIVSEADEAELVASAEDEMLLSMTFEVDEDVTSLSVLVDVGPLRGVDVE